MIRRLSNTLGFGISLLASNLSVANSLNWLTFADLGLANKKIQIDDKTASFKTGALGVGLIWNPVSEVFLSAGYGAGLLPDQEATYAGAQVRGDASSSMRYVELEYRDHISGAYGITLEVARVLHDFDGDFDGERNGSSVTSTVDGHFYSTRYGVGATYRFDSDSTIDLGVGRFNWDVSATAQGALGSSIRAQTVASDTGTDNFIFGRYSSAFGEDTLVSFETRYYQLTATNRVGVLEGQVVMSRPF